MIRLKNGHVVGYQEDFDLFFKDLLSAIITESRSVVNGVGATAESPNDLFLREIMDNCIFVTHQLFELSRTNPDFARFMVTGFLFNSIIVSLPQPAGNAPKAGKKDPSGTDIIH